MVCNDCHKECEYNNGISIACNYCKHKNNITGKICDQCIAFECKFVKKRTPAIINEDFEKAVKEMERDYENSRRNQRL